MGQVDYAKLKSQGRVKDIGVPWTPEEAQAVFVKGIPAEYVRDGILTQSDYEQKLEDEKKKGKPLKRMNESDLRRYGAKLGLTFGPDATFESVLRGVESAMERKGLETIDDLEDLKDPEDLEDEEEEEEGGEDDAEAQNETNEDEEDDEEDGDEEEKEVDDEDGDEEDDEEDQPSRLSNAEIDDLSRKELEKYAASIKIVEPEKFKNRKKLAAAIKAKLKK